MQQNRHGLKDDLLSSRCVYHWHCQNVHCGPHALQGAPTKKAEPGLLPRRGRVKPPFQQGSPQRNPHYFGSWSSHLCRSSEKGRSLPGHHSLTCQHKCLYQPMTAHLQLCPAEHKLLKHSYLPFIVKCCWVTFEVSVTSLWLKKDFSGTKVLFGFKFIAYVYLEHY